jgi:hypothetical protein
VDKPRAKVSSPAPEPLGKEGGSQVPTSLLARANWLIAGRNAGELDAPKGRSKIEVDRDNLMILLDEFEELRHV